MNDILKTYMERFRENRHTLRRYTAFVLALAMITTLFVNWQLHGVGISMTAQYQCGEEEHAHTADCYTKVLTCGYEEGELENADEVAAAATSQSTVEAEPAPLALEPQIEFVPHEHTDDCYIEVQTLTCMEEEHVHGDDCFDPEDGNRLICDKFEHTHDESCYTTEYELTCGLEEGELVEQVVEPTQSAELAAMAAAKPVALEPVVDTVEPIYHHHTDACYEEVLTCPLPEHQHTVACLSDTSADLETPEEWQAANAEAVISGNWAEDLVSVAKTQLGYEQSEKNFEIDPADGVTLRYYSRYGQSYGNPYGEWDVMFLSYCLKYAGIPQSAIPQEASVLALRSSMSDMDWLLDGEDGSSADVGDIVIYNKYVTRTVAVDSSADGAADGLDDQFSMDAEGENGAELEESGDSALDTTPTTDSVTTPDTTDTAVPSVVSPAAEPQTTTVTDAQPVETVGIVSEADENMLTVISGDVDGKVAEVTLSNAEVLGVVSVAYAQYADEMLSSAVDGALYSPMMLSLMGEGEGSAPTTSCYDFTNDITSAKLQYRSNDWQKWTDITADSVISEYDQIQAYLKYTLPAKTLSSTQNTIMYPLPDALKNFKENGTVYDNDNKAVGTGKIENGAVYITFYDDYVQKNAGGSPINGYVAFDGKAYEMEIPSDQKTTITFNDKYSSTITIKQDYSKKGDIHTQKSTGRYDLENGTVEYTVKVWSQYGTADHPIQLEDIMTDIKLDTAKGITVVKNDGTPASINDLFYKADDKGFTGTLPALGENEYYELTYWGVLPPDLKGGNVTTTNNIHVESKNSEEKEIKSDASVDFSFNTVKKTGVKVDENTISWTVNLNENHADMKNWTLSDELNGSDYTGNVHIVTSKGAAFDVSLPYKFGTNPADADTTASYTITYKTTDDHPYNTSQVKNKVTLKDDHNNEKGSSEYDVEVGSKDAFIKTGTGVTDNGDGTLTLNWKVKLIIDEDYAAGWHWCDYASWNSQYFTPTQRQKLYKQLNTLLGDGNYTVTDCYNPKFDNDIGDWDSIGIIGNKTLTKGTTLEFSFSTTANVPSTKTEFKNHCSFNNTGFDGTNNYNPSGNVVVKKYDKYTGSAANSSHEYHKLKNGMLEWEIHVTMTEAFKNTASTLTYIDITDTLPAGVTLDDIDIHARKDSNYKWQKTSNIDKNGSTWTIHTCDKTNGDKPGPDITATLQSLSDGKTSVTIQVPVALLQLMDVDYDIVVYVYAKTADPATWGDETQKDFTNEVRVTDSDNHDWGTASQTQEITYNSLYNTVQKKGEHLDASGAQNTVEYTVLVNPDHTTILGDPNIRLTLVDELKYTYSIYYAHQLTSLVPSSVAVYEYDTNADNNRGRKLTVGEEYSYLYETIGYGSGTPKEDRTNRLTFSLPNAKALVVVYRYTTKADSSVWIDLNNTATLKAKTTIVTTDTDYQHIQITSSSYGAGVLGVVAYKVDKDNNGLYLPGAEFSLYAWNGSSSDPWTPVSHDIVTDSKGELVNSDGQNLTEIIGDEIIHNQAFMLVETKAPAGYVYDPDNAYYFYIPDSDTNTYPIKYPTDLTGYHVATAGGYIYLTNEKDQSQDYELPSTGGTGTLPYTAVGGTMMLTALAYSFIHHKRRREGRADD